MGDEHNGYVHNNEWERERYSPSPVCRKWFYFKCGERMVARVRFEALSTDIPLRRKA